MNNHSKGQSALVHEYSFTVFIWVIVSHELWDRCLLCTMDKEVPDTNILYNADYELVYCICKLI